MSYQIPSVVQIFECYEEGGKDLSVFTPEKDVKLKNVIVSMFLKGMADQDFYIGCRVWLTKQKIHINAESEPVLISSIPRNGQDWYGEVRFDFPTNVPYTIGNSYFLEFYIEGEGYIHSNDDYVGLIIDHDSPLATMNPNNRVIRHSMFFQKL